MRLLAIVLGILWLLMPPQLLELLPALPPDSERFGVGLAGPAGDISWPSGAWCRRHPCGSSIWTWCWGSMRPGTGA
jgi:hypothetical protein